MVLSLALRVLRGILLSYIPCVRQCKTEGKRKVASMAKKVAACPENKAAGPTPTVTIRMPEEIRCQLEDIAKTDDRSLSWLILKILRDYLEARRAKK
jgi:hypothetical protein